MKNWKRLTMRINISTLSEYEYCINRGFAPLIDWRNFYVQIGLRKHLQFELFGSSDFDIQNQRFYKYIWDNSPHVCHETGRPLYNYSASFISHIISRGSNRAMSIDPRNANVLFTTSHNKWEYGNRKDMNIYPMNQLIIKELKQDYNIN